jgi:predicted PurR-regulated permease PerM
MSDALEVHPAAVLVMVIISASLFGLVGVLLAAPVLASLKLIFTYIVRKLMDADPWRD